MAALYRALEPLAQADYQRLLGKMEISEEVARANEASKVSGILEDTLIRYMAAHGYSYHPDKGTFVPRRRP